MRRSLIVVASLVALFSSTSGSRAGTPAAGSVAYVANEASDSVSEIDLATGARVEPDIAVGTAPYGLALAPGGGRLYVSHAGAKPELQIVATNDRKAWTSIPLSAGSPRDVAVAPDGSKIYVALHDASAVAVVDALSQFQTAVISVPTFSASTGTSGLAMTPDGAKLYVINDVDSSWSVVSTATDSVTAGPFRAPTGAARGRISPYGDWLMIVGSGAPLVVSTWDDQPVTYVDFGARGAQTDVAFSGVFAYVTNRSSVADDAASIPAGSAAIDVYTIDLGGYLTSIPLGDGVQPTSIVASPDARCAWASCLGGGGTLRGIDCALRTTSGAPTATGPAPRTVVAQFASRPDTVLSGYLLPKVVQVRARGAGRDTVLAKGVYDEGDRFIDYASPASVTVGGFSATVPLRRAGAARWISMDRSTRLVLRPPKSGGPSRGTWSLVATRKSLDGLVPTDGVVDVAIAPSGLSSAGARVRLTDGSFVLGRTRGTLIAPTFVPLNVAWTFRPRNRSSVSFHGRFASGGVVPVVVSDGVKIYFGDFLGTQVLGMAMTSTGPGRFKSVIPTVGEEKHVIEVDFVREIVTYEVTNSGVDAMPAGAIELVFDAGLGAGTTRVTVRVGGTTKNRRY